MFNFRQVKLVIIFTDPKQAKIDGCFTDFELVVFLLTLNKPILTTIKQLKEQ